MNRRNFFSHLKVRGATGESPPSSNRVELFSNPLVLTHENKQVRFYDDLIKGRQVIINLMYVSCEGACPAITSKLAQVHKSLKHRMGKDLFMYSITMYPEQDDPASLKDYARMHGALLPGWTFLTGDAYDIETIRFRLFRWNHIKFDLDLGLHASKLRIINDATNCWTKVNPQASLYTILQHISWADPPKSIDERLKENKALQERIDQDVKQHGYRRTT